MLYNNMISVTNTWVGQGKLSPGVGLWGIHAVMMVITARMFYRRMKLFSLRRLLADKRPLPDTVPSAAAGSSAFSPMDKEETR
jgi:hypothetical protein